MKVLPPADASAALRTGKVARVGVFYSASRFCDALQPVIRVLPLTALSDALREVMSGKARLSRRSARTTTL